MNESSQITELKGIGEKTAALFHRVGVYSLWDLMTYYPRDYELFEEPVSMAECQSDSLLSLRLTISGNPELRHVKGLSIVSCFAKDETGIIKITWFHMPYLKKTLRQGSTYIFRGTVQQKGQSFILEQPRIYKEEDYKKLVSTLQPVYSVTKGLTSSGITKMVTKAFQEVPEYEDYLLGCMEHIQLMEMNRAIKTMHFPTRYEEVVEARKRLVFDEFFFFIMGIRRLKEDNGKEQSCFRMVEVSQTSRIIDQLPYELTNAQKRTWDEILLDLTGNHVMNRLVQGDVGSGKTIIAVLALITAGCNGWQGALMAPTEVLAAQHMESLSRMFCEYQIPLKCVLVTGSMTAKQKREAREMIASGEASVIIGTHALIQEKVIYKNLALVITDEQHRFGVKQREAFAQKTDQTPHVLVMSATPIPRTLAIIVYGDLDISVMDELPSERLPIKNCVVDTGYRKKAYEFIGREVAAGRQAYVICPMVEESEALDAENVMDYAKRLREILPAEICVEYLHGKMRPKDKNEIMGRFASGDIHVLVSTTVVEVGVNVPNATVMMVENADRFGLAQLHQLRGRVGRGMHQSYCIFVSGSKNKETMQRLSILNKSNDGFEIAREDLKLRGPGDFFGFRQSGEINFKIGDIFTDAAILKEAAGLVGQILEEDRELQLPKHLPIRRRLSSYMQNRLETISL